MAEVFFLDSARTFSLEDAQAVLPIVRRVTERAREKYLSTKHNFTNAQFVEDRMAIEEELQDVVRTWARSIERLGARPRPLWTVDFDSGHGYWCWQHPEPVVSHFHSYDAGFSARVPVR